MTTMITALEEGGQAPQCEFDGPMKTRLTKEAVSSAVRFFPPSHAHLPGKPAHTPHTFSPLLKVMYTPQKNKKAKTWHDGFLHVADDFARASLFDTTNKTKLDSTFLSGPIKEDDDLETEKFLVQVVELYQAKPTSLSALNVSSSSSSYTATNALRPPPLRPLNAALSRPFQPPSAILRPMSASIGEPARKPQFSYRSSSSLSAPGTDYGRHRVIADDINTDTNSTYAPKRLCVPDLSSGPRLPTSIPISKVEKASADNDYERHASDFPAVQPIEVDETYFEDDHGQNFFEDSSAAPSVAEMPSKRTVFNSGGADDGGENLDHTYTKESNIPLIPSMHSALLGHRNNNRPLSALLQLRPVRSEADVMDLLFGNSADDDDDDDDEDDVNRENTGVDTANFPTGRFAEKNDFVVANQQVDQATDESVPQIRSGPPQNHLHKILSRRSPVPSAIIEPTHHAVTPLRQHKLDIPSKGIFLNRKYV